MKKTNIAAFCEKYEITDDQFYGRSKIEGDLDLDDLTNVPEGFNPMVDGFLYLSGVKRIPEGFNPTVSGDLDLSGATSIPKGFSPTVGVNLKLNRITNIVKDFNPTVGRDIYMNRITSIPEGFNPNVGDYLFIDSMHKYIGAKVDIPLISPPDLKWNNGQYICKDGILTEVIEQKDNVYRVRKIAHEKIEYLVTDGNGNWAHGATLEEAKKDLIYKVNDRKKSDYEHLTLNDSISHADAIKMIWCH